MSEVTRLAARLLLQLPVWDVRRAITFWESSSIGIIRLTGPFLSHWIFVERRRAMAYAKRALYLRGYA